MIEKLRKRGSSLLSAARGSRERDINVSEMPNLILNQKWKSMRRLLSFQRENIVEYTDSWSSDDGETLLHWVCRFHPPLDILESIYVCSPKCIQQVDKLGRYPIHTACKYGASMIIIAFLLKSCKLTASAQDEMGKTPLHLVAQYYFDNYAESSPDYIPAEKAMVEVVKILCLAAKNIVNLEDHNDMSALEIALEYSVPLKVLKAIQRASEKDWKARQSVYPCHDMIRCDMMKRQENSKRRLEHDTFDVTTAVATMAAVSSMEDKKQQFNGKHEKTNKNPPFFFIKPLRERQKQKQFRANAA